MSERWFKRDGGEELTGGEDGGDDSAPLGPGERLQFDVVDGGGAELGHAVRGGRGAEHHFLK